MGSAFAGNAVARAFGGIPESLREELLGTFSAVVNNHREGRWEGAELNAGKLCEVVYTIIKGHVDGHIPDRASKPRDMVAACRALEQAPSASVQRALRIQIPRVMLGIYEMRNNRNVGHVGGDVNPSHMDSEFAVSASRWIMADLVRAFHNVTVQEATRIVEALIEREVPLIWEGNGVKRVLDPKLPARDKVLLLLYGTPGPVAEDTLRAWAEYKHQSRFKSEILAALHAEKLIEYDFGTGMVHLLPPGARYVEQVQLEFAA